MSARPVGTWFLVVAGIAVAASLIAAIAVIGSPSHQRNLRFDERREHELVLIKNAIEQHARSERRLPQALAELRQSDGTALNPVDPQTRQPYGYRALDARRYELCATFATARRPRDGSEPYVEDRWRHPAGRHCFTHALPKAGGAAQGHGAMAAAEAAIGSVETDIDGQR
ncbi:MAG: hypothetical protein AVDCRST_MAG71-57 [uncultured Lysobacter sp.]|uniref:Type II secretion system protein n=1 Tax=uncultured Lysobacter sp. TaxID=271060 RepID=A0A6J4KBD6_9GAMM|nr:MAG: hypothetical protein AVDCRST_MAG71-57 [uncultured Lysobacter sp.]